MWCHERKRQRPVLAKFSCAVICLTAFAGSAAALESSPPSLKISGKATFRVEARSLGEGYEVSAVLSDEVGRPLPQAEVRARALTDGSVATLRRCGAPRGERGGELLLSTDNSGRVCLSVTGAPTENVELSYQDARGYFERGTQLVRLPEMVAASFEVGFDPQLTSVSLDQPSLELGLLARAAAGGRAPEAAELVLSMAADGAERELGRTPLDGLGEVHRLTLLTSSFGAPGPARLIARLVDRGGRELSRATIAVMRTVTVNLSVGNELSAGVEAGAQLQLRAASALGPAPSGIVEAQSRGLSVAAAPVRGGAATLSLPSSSSSLLGGALQLEYVGANAGWLSAPPIEVRIRAAGPSYARYALWIAAAALAALAVVLSWRRPPRARPAPPAPPPRARASVEVLEPFGAGSGYRGLVRDAHEGFGISPAVVSFIGPGANRPVVLEVRTNAQGAFLVENAAVLPQGCQVEVSAPFHATLIAALPVPGVIELSLVSRRRALIERLVRWAERHGRPWSQPVGEPTPHHIASVAASEAQPQVERWARRMEDLAYGPTPPDAASEQAAGVIEDPTVRRDSGID